MRFTSCVSSSTHPIWSKGICCEYRDTMSESAGWESKRSALRPGSFFRAAARLPWPARGGKTGGAFPGCNGIGESFHERLSPLTPHLRPGDGAADLPELQLACPGRMRYGDSVTG